MSTAKLTKNQLFAAICLGLAAGTFLLYWPIMHDGFTNFDDDGYITGNPHIKGGLNWAAIVWAFKSGYAANWHPLTWISHMIDFRLFGLDPVGHHFMNLLFHTANTLLLFFLLNNLTGAIWRSAFVAALFAWHPLHVESVAWAAERKDVLSAFFWMLTLIAYDYYVKARSSSRPGLSTLNYLLALFLFACGLMSKPMVVTLPCVLLLLDFWPLQRLTVSTSSRLLLEKIPFFILSFTASVVTYLVQKTGGAVSGDPLSFRVLNALWAYERYIAKIFWPAGLAIVYPFPTHGLLLLGIVAAILLALCSLAFTFLSGQRPYFFTGWFWFIGTLVPAIGVVEVGSASMADRYSYLPSIGLFILVTWALADYVESHGGKNLLGIAGTIVLAICFVLTSIQIKYWRSSIALFSHALQVTTDNYVADACLGQALDAAGDDKDALIYCQQAVQIDPDYPPGQFFLGTVLWKTGDSKDAESHLDTAAKASPHDSGFQYNVGKFFMERGQFEQAAAYFTFAITNNPDNPDLANAHNALGKTYLKEGNANAAAGELVQAITLDPGNAQFHYDLGTVLFNHSKPTQAISEFSRAIELQPDYALAHDNLAVALAGEGKLSEAIPHFAKVVQLQPKDPDARFNLGLAYLNNHQPAEAAVQFSEELNLAPNQARAHYRLAQAMAQQKDFTEAAEQYYQTLKLTPSFPDAKTELDQILTAHPELRRLSN
jgi:tetratricopeptide (TPR) repeat protein